MKKAFFIPLTLLLMLLLTTTVFATGDLTAERTSYGMQIDSSILENADGFHFCAVYDEDGRMLAVEEVTEADSTVYCDVNAVRTVNLFSFGEENTFIPTGVSVDTTLEAPSEPIHVHIWDKGTLADEPNCRSEGLMVYTCTAADCNETPNATYREVLPRTEHPWSDWNSIDESNHLRSCTAYDFHIETAPHNWVLNLILQEPTYTSFGWARYNCPDCHDWKTEQLSKLEPKEVWFTYNADDGFIINWLETNETFGKMFYVNNREVYGSFIPLSELAPDLSELTTMDIVIEAGYYGEEPTLLYTAEDAIQVIDSETPNFTLTGQTDGTYLVGADFDTTGMTVNARLIHDDGETELVTETYDTPYINIYPWDGSTIELSAMVCTISEDTEHLTITRTPTENITTFTRPTVPADRTVTTAEELQTALTVGGKVTLGADITADGMNIYGGEPVTLNLNGHTLNISRLRFDYGKEVTIDGTAEGSAIVGELYINCADKLTIRGGSYDALSLDWINEIKLEDAAFTSDEYTAISASDCFDVTMTGCTATSAGSNAMTLNRGEFLSIENSTLTTSAPYSTTQALRTSGVDTIRLIDITASSVSGSAVELSPAPAYGSSDEIYTGSSVFVRGGSYTSHSTDSAAAALLIKDFETADIGGVIDPASDPADLQISSACHGIYLDDVSGDITLSDITAEATGEGTGGYNLFLIYGTRKNCGAVTATRLNGTGGYENTLRIENRTSLTLENSSFTATNNSSRYPAAMSIKSVDHVTIRDTEGSGGYSSLNISNCADVDLSNMDLRNSSTFALNAYNIADFNASACGIYGTINCWKDSNYVGNSTYIFAPGCILHGDLSATGDRDCFISVDIRGCTFSGMTQISEYSEIIR